jgi:hypothetical protein
VTLTGSETKTTTTNILGSYSFGGLPNGVYTVIPNKEGFAFTPEGRTVTIDDAVSRLKTSRHCLRVRLARRWIL